MPYPQQTFPDFASLLAFINTNWVSNGAGDIDAVIGNDVVNGLLTFVEQSPINWQTAQIISSGGSVSGTRPVVIFMTNTPTSLQWTDNIYNQYIFVNTTSSAIPLGGGQVYYDINLVAQTTIPAKTVVSILKATNGQWVSIYNAGGSGNTSSFEELSATVTIGGTTFTDTKLIGADPDSLKFLILNKQIYTVIDGDFTFDNVDTITFLHTTLFVGDTLVIPFNKLL